MSIPEAHPDFTCECGETYLILGDTREKQVAALEAWPGCGCEEGSS
jgi:hypothetical protein